MACGKCGSGRARTTYLHTAPDGKKTVYSSETEANAAKARKGGTVKAQ